ncbi:MAG: hypothetical protein IJW00_03440 [Clostridia bacterium]|nr:hypothetical protein [Clostridia bacterium]
MTELTLREIWDRIVTTQDQLESIDKVVFYMTGVEESGSFVQVEESASEHYGEPLPYCKEVALEKIHAMKEVMIAREQTLKGLLDFYVSVYHEQKSKTVSE